MRTHGSGEKHKNTEKRGTENSRERKIEQLRQPFLGQGPCCIHIDLLQGVSYCFVNM